MHVRKDIKLIADILGMPTYYRVYHIEMDETKWLWGVEGLILLLNYGVSWFQEVCKFEFWVTTDFGSSENDY